MGDWENMMGSYEYHLECLNQPIDLPFFKYYKAVFSGILNKKNGKYYWAGSEVVRA